MERAAADAGTLVEARWGGGSIFTPFGQELPCYAAAEASPLVGVPLRTGPVHLLVPALEHERGPHRILGDFSVCTPVIYTILALLDP